MSSSVQSTLTPHGHAVERLYRFRKEKGGHFRCSLGQVATPVPSVWEAPVGTVWLVHVDGKWVVAEGQSVRLEQYKARP